jgi:hypothetical protein
MDTIHFVLKDGKSEFIIPSPAMATHFAIRDFDDTVCIIFAMKTPKEEVPSIVEKRVLREFPNDEWIRTNGYPYRCGPNGAPTPYVHLGLSKVANEDGDITLVMDETTFASIREAISRQVRDGVASDVTLAGATSAEMLSKQLSEIERRRAIAEANAAENEDDF